MTDELCSDKIQSATFINVPRVRSPMYSLDDCNTTDLSSVCAWVYAAKAR